VGQKRWVMRCDTCGRYELFGMIRVSLEAESWLDMDGWWELDERIPAARAEYIAGDCTCGGRMELLEIDTDVCPHWWELDYSTPAARVCRICGERQEGKIVFEVENEED
jgi:hypothetical protein